MAKKRKFVNGKSTLIKMLTMLLPTSSGSATVGGFDVGRQT